jgi:hypothetical protein
MLEVCMRLVMFELRGFLVALVIGGSVILAGCSGSGDESGGGTPTVLAGTEINATAIHYEDDNETGGQVAVWNDGYTSPVEDAVVRVNGITLTYSSGVEFF